MSQHEGQDIEEATTAMTIPLSGSATPTGAPDAKTRRYDRQLRLWAATGQSALEASRILVLSASATSTSILKNLVLPGIGHFTVLDPLSVSPADAGNNFFLDGPRSIGKPRAAEAVRLLRELNDGVAGVADTRDLRKVLDEDPAWIKSFSLVVAHNLSRDVVERLSALLWVDTEAPPLVVVRSAGFLGEFYIQYHEHQIIETHSETAPSLRIDQPFPALRDYALLIDFAGMDPTEHGHVPYVYILIRAMEDWKTAHGGLPPQTYPDKQAFKAAVRGMRRKADEENFDEAEAQAYRAWTATTVPSDVSALFTHAGLSDLSTSAAPFVRLLAALRRFIAAGDPALLPLSAALPDMKADTAAYIALQRLYRARADEEKARFKAFIEPAGSVDDALVDSFVKNAHALRVLQGKQWGAFDKDPVAIAAALEASPRQTATHLALSALSNLTAKTPDAKPTAEAITQEVRAIVGDGVTLPEQELSEAVGEIARAPTADLPNVAAFLGGLVAQEAIKLITTQYVPINGYCVVDLVETWTGVIP